MIFFKIKNLADYFLNNKKKFYYLVIILSAFVIYKDVNHFYNSLLYGLLILIPAQLLRFWALTYNFKINKSKLPTDFVSTGPYAYLRNPIYLANILVIFALSFILGARYFAIFSLIIFFIIYNLVSVLEEENLLKLKGKEYYRYKSSINRWIPSLYIKISQEQEKFFFWEALKFELAKFKYYLIIIGISIIKQLILNILKY